MNVPFSVGSVRAALAEPERVARCVPGLQLDSAGGAGSAGSTNAKGTGGTTEGRLRVRVGGSTITYRGSLTVTSRGEEFTVKGTGTEARGTGSVRLNLTVVPRRSKEGEGTRLVCTGTVKGDGRINDVEQKAAATAGQRLLERFGKALADSIQENPPGTLDAPEAPAAEPATAGPVGGIGEPGDNDRVIPGIPGPDNRESQTSAPQTGAAKDQAAKAEAKPADKAKPAAKAEDKAKPADKAKPQDKAAGPEADRAKGGKKTGDGAGESKAKAKDKAEDEGKAKPADKPKPQPEPKDEPEDHKDKAEPKDEPTPDERPSGREGVFGTEVPPPSLDPLHDDEPLDEAEVEAAAEAEAAHARRTMIGRSAEEVDHAPPRGRYAPVPLPEPIANSAALRWVAPAAAAVVAGAVVIGRALRRRR
ncbi:hypothetical protein [Streptomyces abyssalis]|uniref:hypothetical protein n=1 Tax=Streptomyces abyssalis TaxID=933944 RepID=UPI00085C2713|nr:hypothetical protein [Streptomyces abyssalis]